MNIYGLFDVIYNTDILKKDFISAFNEKSLDDKLTFLMHIYEKDSSFKFFCDIFKEKNKIEVVSGDKEYFFKAINNINHNSGEVTLFEIYKYASSVFMDKYNLYSSILNANGKFKKDYLYLINYMLVNNIGSFEYKILQNE